MSNKALRLILSGGLYLFQYIDIFTYIYYYSSSTSILR